jgi:sortase A
LGLSAIVLAGCTILLFQYKQHFSRASGYVSENIGLPSTHELVSVQKSIGLPMSIKIPSIRIDAAIEKVALTADGAMDVPKEPADAAWFDLGPRPGEKGSAVIVGHYGWKNGIQAVFDNLYKLQKGDKLYVEDEKGVITAFVVRELRTYGEKEDASDVFVSSDGASHLNLITCEGVWNKTQKSYSNRLVVFTDREDPRGFTSL